jgi:flotillin
VKGEAEAYAIEAKAKAEAEQMAKKADAWKDYQEAAMVDMVLDTLPKVLYALLLLYLRPVQNQMVKVFKGGRQG